MIRKKALITRVNHSGEVQQDEDGTIGRIIALYLVVEDLMLCQDMTNLSRVSFSYNLLTVTLQYDDAY